MFNWSLETFTETLKETLGSNLLAVLLYGSRADGEIAGKDSNHNVFILAEKLDLETLQNLSKPISKWCGQKNPPPLLLTRRRFLKSLDVFPIEFLDIQDQHKVLYGSDPFENLSFNTGNLRTELEHELKGKLIALRNGFLLTENKPAKINALMVQSLSTFLVLFKSALHLFGVRPPKNKMEALQVLQTKITFDGAVFVTVLQMKKGQSINEDAFQLFKKYLSAVELIVDAVDSHVQSEVQ